MIVLDSADIRYLPDFVNTGNNFPEILFFKLVG